MVRVTAGTTAYGSPDAWTNRRPATPDLLDGVIDRERRPADHGLVVHIRDDTDDPAALVLDEQRIGPP